MDDDFELRLLRGQVPGLPSEAYEKHRTAVEFALALGIEPKHVGQLLGGAVLRTNEEVDAFDFSESPPPCQHENASEPLWSGGNYGHYGTQWCACGKSKDAYSDWS